jgi:phospholipase C
MDRFLLRPCAILVAAALAQVCLPTKGRAQQPDSQLVTLQPDPASDVLPFYRDWTKGNEPALSREQTIEHLRAAIKYVFVIFQENESFDHYFGTFPGANGLYSDGQHPRGPKDTPGFTQIYQNIASGETVTVEPFLIGPGQNANVLDSVDHSHEGKARKIDVTGNEARMDQFAFDEYNRFAKTGGPKNDAEGTQFARLVMSHVDCDTVPFLWQYARRFVLFDKIFATENSPSTPNALALISGQGGETQWVKHGANGRTFTIGTHSGTTHGPPLVADQEPFYGSQFDVTEINRQPVGTKDHRADNFISSNLTFASLPLTFLGRDVKAVMSQDLDKGYDEPDIQRDIEFIARLGGNPVAWRWYEEGYDHEPTDFGAAASHDGYISHHEAPQYFGYLANNPALRDNFRGLGDFFTDMATGAMPRDGGVFYVRGGRANIFNQTPFVLPGTSPANAQAIEKMRGDDDHPGYSDHQISEALTAHVINAVASNPDIWKQSVIILSYDESDGFYDHVPPRILSYGPDHLPLARGIRTPLIVISPYARVHAVSHAEGDHNAVIETINALFGRPALASLPDEAEALATGRAPAFNGPNGFVQNYLGPRDINSSVSDDLLSAFDPKRLLGLEPPLPGSYASISEEVVDRFPHYGAHGCAALGITTEDRRQGIENKIPPGFNPLPATYTDAN